MENNKLSRVALKEQQKNLEKLNKKVKPRRKIKFRYIVLGILASLILFIIWWFVAVNANFAGTKSDIAAFDKKDISKDSAVTLVLGVDGLDKTDLKNSTDLDDRRGIRSDSIMLMATNPHTTNVKTISVYRDLLITDACTGLQDKLNSTFANGWMSSNSDDSNQRIARGATCMKKTLENYFDLKINNYAVINFSGFEKIINAVGGVDIDVIGHNPKGTKFCEQDKFSRNGNPNEGAWNVGKYCFVIGTHRHLNGAEALSYSRHRHSDDDRWRTMRQAQVLGAVVKAVKSPWNILKLPFNTANIKDAFTTNISSSDANGYILGHLFNLSNLKVKRLDLHYIDDMINGTYYLEINENDKANAVREMKELLNY